MRLGPRAAVGSLAAAGLFLLAVPAGASVSTTPASGSAQSALTLLSLSAGGETASVGSVGMTASGVSSPAALIDLVPARLDGTAIGERTVTPGHSLSESPVNATLPNGAGTLTGPALTATASTTGGQSVAQTVASALGAATVDGTPLGFGVSSLSDVAKVDSSQAASAKTIRISNIALPTVYSLLTQMGLNLSVLDARQLESLYSVVSQTVSSTQAAAVTAAESQVGSAVTTTLPAAQSSLQTATTAETAAAATLQSQLNALTGPTLLAVDTALGLPPATVPTVSDLTATTIPLVEAADAALTSAIAAWQSAVAAVAAAQALVTGLTELITSVGAALAADPLAALGGITFATDAVASRTPTATAVADVGSLDVLGVASADLGTFTTAFNATGAKLVSVLDGLGTGVAFTAPALVVGQVSHSTGVSGGYYTAAASVTGLRLTLPTLTLPASLSVTGKAVSTPAGGLTVASLTDSARFRPASTLTGPPPPGGVRLAPAMVATSVPGATPSNGPSLAETGLPVGIPVTALVLVGAALLARRRLAGGR
jgi:hypothetical protein